MKDIKQEAMTYSTNYSVDKSSEDYALAEWSLRNGEWKVGEALRPIHNSIIFTKEELEARDRRVAVEAWDAGYSKCWHNEFGKILPEPPNKETYLNSLINK